MSFDIASGDILNLDLEWDNARDQLYDILFRMQNQYDLGQSSTVKASVSFSSVGATEVTVPHGQQGVPQGYLVIEQEGLGTLYKSKSADRENYYFKCDVVGTTFKVVFL